MGLGLNSSEGGEDAAAVELTDKSPSPPRRSLPPKRSTAGLADGPFLCDVEGAEGRSAGDRQSF